ncbi:MAG: 30S ribosomal protein S6 [Desulfobacterales bacterium]
MRRYETIFISDPDLLADDRAQLFEKTKDLIAKQNGFLVLFDEWGVKKLAYDIKKKGRGHYVRIDFCGDGALVAELERSFRIDDRVMKFMTIVLNKDVDLEKVKEEIAREAEAEKRIEAQDDELDESSELSDSDEMEIKNDTEE